MAASCCCTVFLWPKDLHIYERKEKNLNEVTFCNHTHCHINAAAWGAGCYFKKFSRGKWHLSTWQAPRTTSPSSTGYNSLMLTVSNTSNCINVLTRANLRSSLIHSYEHTANCYLHANRCILNYEMLLPPISLSLMVNAKFFRNFSHSHS